MVRKPDLPKVEFEYIEIDDDRPPELYFNYLTPIILCKRCEERYTEDHERGGTGRPVIRSPWEEEEENPYFSFCEQCIGESFGEAFEHDVLSTIEKKLGLTEKDRDALKGFIQTIFTDPKKILKVQELDNRVAGLEKQVSSLWTALAVSVALIAIGIGAAIAIAIAVFG